MLVHLYVRSNEDKNKNIYSLIALILGTMFTRTLFLKLDGQLNNTGLVSNLRIKNFKSSFMISCSYF